MADLMRRYAIPRAVPDALLEGLAWDTQDRRYETIEDLFDYAARVAGTVGVMMTLLMGVRSPDALARACDLGLAMQLTNIARDVGEDARNGRLYLPRAWMREAGLDPDAFIADPQMSEALKGVIARLLAVADELYARARSGVAHLPLACRPAILAAGLIYAEIGRALEALSHDSISHRAHVPSARKAWLLTRAVAATPWLARGASVEPLPAVAFLVEAVKQTPAAPKAAVQPRPFVNVESQFIRVLDIFERLERAEQMSKSR
jgi:phytoene synthase